MGTAFIIVCLVLYLTGAVFTVYVIDVDDRIYHFKTDEVIKGILAFGWPIVLPIFLSNGVLWDEIFKKR